MNDKTEKAFSFDWKTSIAGVSLLVSCGSFFNSCNATKISKQTAEANREAKISLTNLQLKDTSQPVVTYDLKNYGQAKADALAVVPIVVTRTLDSADWTQSEATMTLNPGEQVSRTYEFNVRMFPDTDKFPTEDIRSGRVPLLMHFDLIYRDVNESAEHKCVAFRYVVAIKGFDRDSDCPPMYTNKNRPF